MNKSARILFLLVGCIFPIFVGALHTITHFKDLVTPEIFNYLQKEILILGEPQTIWNAWGMVSFMMGISFIIMGLINISILKVTSNALPVLPIVAMILYLLCIIYAGYTFNGAFQLYGGIFGISLMIICGILNFRYGRK